MPAEVIHQRPQDESESEGEGANQSQASTDTYLDHEPFAIYKIKVLQLCCLLWPTYPAESFLIDRLKGGASNRIVSIHLIGTWGSHPPARTSLPDLQNGPVIDSGLPEGRSILRGVNSSEDNQGMPERLSAEVDNNRRKTEKPDLPPGDYVLRIPRWGEQSCIHEIAMLRFVRRRISIDIPIVVHYDTNCGVDNPLGSPYVLQHRVSGQRLDDMWPGLKNTQRLMIALEIARLYTQLMKISNTSGGIPDVEQGLAADGTLRTMDYYFPGDKVSKKALSPQPPVDMLCERLARWGGKYPNKDGSSPYYGAMEMVRHMQTTQRTFGAEDEGSLYYLNHGDLFPRNIMVEVPSENAAFVTGILDWDDAHFAPAVVSFLPPAWLWMTGFWKEYSEEGYLEEEDLWGAAKAEPKDEGSREIKALFDEIVGSQFLRYAYSPDACAARKIWRSAYETMGKSWVESEVESMFREWKIEHGRATNIE